LRIETDPWLQRQLGIAVLVVRLGTEDSAWHVVREEISRALRESVGDSFFHAKIPVERVEQVAALTSAGFAVVDVNVTYSRDSGPPGEATGTERAEIEIRPLTAVEGTDVIELASRCFTRSRFHLDPIMPDEVANRINEAWVADYVEGKRGELLDGAFLEGRLVGFNAVLRANVEGKEALVIDLIGVDPAYQGLGIGRALVTRFLSWSEGRCAEVRVGTQVANTPAVRLYERFGFRLTEARYVLHAHVRHGAVRSWS